MNYRTTLQRVCTLLTCGSLLLPALPVTAQDLIPTGVLETPLETTSGDTASLSDYRGSIVLLHFVASWCGECMIEAPSLNSLASAFEGRDLVVVAVSIDVEVVAAKAFSEQLKLSYPVLVDTKGFLKRKFAVRGVPMTMVLDKQGTPKQFMDPISGKLVSRIEGPRDWASAAAIASLKKLVGEATYACGRWPLPFTQRTAGNMPALPLLMHGDLRLHPKAPSIRAATP